MQNYDEIWKVNQKFLEERISMGDKILLTNNPYELYLFKAMSQQTVDK